jgi:hypothetical protein
MPNWSPTLERPALQLLALLLVGHIVADFLVQTSRIAREKPTRLRFLLAHGGWTGLTHLALVLPFWNGPVVLGVLAVSVFHVLLDGARARLGRRWHRPLASFFLDQTLHAASLVLLWSWIVARGAHLTGMVPPDAQWLPALTRYAVLAGGLVFNAAGGTMVVRKLLERYPQVVPDGGDPDGAEYTMGRTIGCLERFLVFGLVLLGQWAAIGFVIAAKSIARFQELREQTFADYYLIGTLTSLLVAIASGVVVRAVLFR